MEKKSKENHLSRLVVSPQGFVFDPYTGQGYTANEVARFIIDKIMNNICKTDIIQNVQERFKVSSDEAEKDLEDFYHQLHLLNFI